MSGVARSRRDRERLRVSGGRGRHGHDDCRVPASPLPGPVHSPVCPSSCTTPSCFLTSVSYKPKVLSPTITCTTLEVHGLRQVGCSHEVAGRAIINDTCQGLAADTKYLHLRRHAAIRGQIHA